MRNQKLALLNRARMSTLNAIRRFGDTEAETHFRSALLWINTAIANMRHHHGDGSSSMINATTHLQLAARSLGFEPVKIDITSIFAIV